MSQIWDIYCKHCLWSIFGPCWCTKSCKPTFYAHLLRIWKLARFTRFIRKVFATKILLSGKFLLFVTLGSPNGNCPCSPIRDSPNANSQLGCSPNGPEIARKYPQKNYKRLTNFNSHNRQSKFPSHSPNQHIFLTRVCQKDTINCLQKNL